MIRSYQNADASFRSDPMTPRQFKNDHIRAEARTL